MAGALNYIFSGKMKSCPDCEWWDPLCRPVNNYIQPPKCAATNSSLAASVRLPKNPRNVIVMQPRPKH